MKQGFYGCIDKTSGFEKKNLGQGTNLYQRLSEPEVISLLRVAEVEMGSP